MTNTRDSHQIFQRTKLQTPVLGMLPEEIRPYEFESFKKDMLSIPEMCELFKSSKLLSSKEVVQAISNTNQGIVLLVSSPSEFVMYTPDDKIVYSPRTGRLSPKSAVTRFMSTKFLDFSVLHFKRFYCCLSRWGTRVCNLYLMVHLNGKREIEFNSVNMFLNPTLILGSISETDSVVEDTMFKFEDLGMFDGIFSLHDTKEKDKSLFDTNVLPNSSEKVCYLGNRQDVSDNKDIKLNPIDKDIDFCTQTKEAHPVVPDGRAEQKIFAREGPGEKDLVVFPQQDSTKQPFGKETGQVFSKIKEYCIEVESKERVAGVDDECREKHYDSVPYKDIDEGKGIFDCILSGIFGIIGHDDGEGVPAQKGAEATDEKNGTEYFDESDGEEGTDEDSVCIYDGKHWRREDRKSASTIKFGVIKNERLRYIQRRVKPLSVLNFDKFEFFITELIQHLQRSDVNYVEVCSEIDFFIVKKDSTCLYIRDLIHKKEGVILQRFSEMFKNLGTRA